MPNKETFKRILSSKDTWMWAAGSVLLITVLGATMTPQKANAMLAVAVVAFAAAVFFNHNLADDHFLVRAAWACAVGGAAGLGVYYFLWAPRETEPLPPSLQVSYRVTGGEDRGWKVGTKDESKTVLLEMQIVNRSRRKMMLNIAMGIPFKTTDGHTLTVHFEGKWSDNKDAPSLANGWTEYPFLSSAYETLIIEPESYVDRKAIFEIWNYKKIPGGDDAPFPKWSELKPRSLTIRDRLTGLSLQGVSMLGYPKDEKSFHLHFTYPSEDLSKETIEWAEKNRLPNSSDPITVELKTGDQE